MEIKYQKHNITSFTLNVSWGQLVFSFLIYIFYVNPTLKISKQKKMWSSEL